MPISLGHLKVHRAWARLRSFALLPMIGTCHASLLALTNGSMQPTSFPLHTKDVKLKMGLSLRAKTLCPLGFPSIVYPLMALVLKPLTQPRATPFGLTKTESRNRIRLWFCWTNFLLQNLRFSKLFCALRWTKRLKISVCTKIQISSLLLTVLVAVDLKGKRMKFLRLL